MQAELGAEPNETPSMCHNYNHSCTRLVKCGTIVWKTWIGLGGWYFWMFLMWGQYLWPIPFMFCFALVMIFIYSFQNLAYPEYNCRTYIVLENDKLIFCNTIWKLHNLKTPQYGKLLIWKLQSRKSSTLNIETVSCLLRV